MKRILIFIVGLLLVVLGLSFTVMNAAEVQLNYYFGTLAAPLSLVVVGAIAAGAVLGVLASLGMILGQKREMAKLRRTMKLTEKELSNLRALPLKDTH
jgi:putative membrane protein